jgi:ribosomal protein S18 acetylase RimI-like enzyme
LTQPFSIRDATVADIAEVWQEHWGSFIVSVDRQHRPTTVSGLVLEDAQGRRLGLVTWSVDTERARGEIVSIDTNLRRRGYGAELLAAAEARLRAEKVERIWLLTTNDNLDALRFYIRQGYRLVRLYLDALDQVRRLKPAVPEIGRGGIPLRDLWELEKLVPA